MTNIEKAIIRDSKIIDDEGNEVEIKDLEVKTNKIQTIETAEETDIKKYPSTKAVADYVKKKIATAEIYRPAGSVNKTQFEQLIKKQGIYIGDKVHVGYVYNASEPVQYPLGTGEMYPTGTNFVVIENDDSKPERVLDALAGNTSNFLTKLGKEPGSGQEYHFPYNINALTQEASKIKTTFDTISLDDHTVKVAYPIEIPSADVKSDKAGLYTKALADEKISLLGKEAGSGEEYHFPYNVTAITQDADKIKVEFDTITLDNKKTIVHYDNLAVPSADIENNKAGLYNKVLADKKVNVEKTNGNLKSEINNEGNAIQNVITESDADRTVFQQTKEGVSALVTDGTDKSELIIKKDGAYLQVGSEVGTAVSGGQALVRRTTKDAQNASNTIDNQPGQNGCVMQTYLADNKTVISFNTASENGADGVLGQVYAKDYTTGQGMRINFTKTGAYYGVGASTPIDDDHEIIVKGDIKDKVDRIVTENDGAKSIIDNQKGQGGSVMQSEFGDTLVSFNTNSHDGETGILGQIYAKTKSTGVGMRFNIYKDGIYYNTNGTSAQAKKDEDHEIATKGDIKKGITTGRLLSKKWSCMSGLASDMTAVTYKIGDYFVVETIAGSGNNYKPSGSAYVPGTPSTVVETETVNTGDYYIYTADNTWTLKDHTKFSFSVSYDKVAGDPYDSFLLKRELDGRVEKLTDTVSVERVYTHKPDGSEDWRGIAQQIDSDGLITGNLVKNYVDTQDQLFILKTSIVNDTTTGGSTNVASAETVKTLATNKVDKKEGYTLSKITLNGTITDTPTFHAPTTLENGKYLTNDGSKLVWKDLGTIYSYKGSVNTEGELPTGAGKGDVYNIVQASTYGPAGTNVAWDGSAWDALGGTVDLSAYLKTDDLEAKATEKGFTKNLGTITGITMNGASKGTSGVVDLGTVITAHQDISGKQDKLSDTQMSACNSGITSTKVGEYDTHKSNLAIHATSSEKDAWNAKQNALTDAQMSACNSGITAVKVEAYDEHKNDSTIHVTSTDKEKWNGYETTKQDKITATVGSVTQAMYLNAGTFTAITGNVGSTSKGMYLNAGVFTEMSETVGSASQPVYLNAGTITKCSSTVGSTTQLVYMSSGNITKGISITSGTADPSGTPAGGVGSIYIKYTA